MKGQLARSPPDLGGIIKQTDQAIHLIVHNAPGANRVCYSKIYFALAHRINHPPSHKPRETLTEEEWAMYRTIRIFNVSPKPRAYRGAHGFGSVAKRG